MRTGRPTKPNALRELDDSHHRRSNPDEPRLASGPIKPPRGLSKEAKRHWKRLAVILSPLGLLTAGDTDSFSMLAYNLATIDKARAEIARLGGEVLAHKGKV